MILDLQNKFSTNQAVTTTAVSTNVIDTMPSGRQTPVNLGIGKALELFVKVGTAAAAAGAATVTITLESGDNPDLTGNTQVHATTGALALANLGANAVVYSAGVPKGNYRRYLGLRYTVGTGPLTAGTFTGALVLDSDFQYAYASGFTTDA